MKQSVSLHTLILILGLSMLLSSCSKDDKDKDWTETITLFVASNVVDYYPFENDGTPTEGINIREESSNSWSAYSRYFIEGFEFEEGYEYKLSVTKTHLAIQPMDGYGFTYRLNEIVSKTSK